MINSVSYCLLLTLIGRTLSNGIERNNDSRLAVTKHCLLYSVDGEIGLRMISVRVENRNLVELAIKQHFLDERN